MSWSSILPDISPAAGFLLSRRIHRLELVEASGKSHGFLCQEDLTVCNFFGDPPFEEMIANDHH